MSTLLEKPNPKSTEYNPKYTFLPNEAALIADAKGSDPVARKAAREVLFDSIQEFIRLTALRVGHQYFQLDVDEVQQDLSVYALRYPDTFDPAKGHPYRFYCYFRIKMAVGDLLRLQNRPHGLTGHGQRDKSPLPTCNHIDKVPAERICARKYSLDETPESEAMVDLDEYIGDVAEVCGLDVNDLTLHLLDGVSAEDLRMDPKRTEEARELVRQELQGKRIDAKAEARRLFDRLSYDDRLSLIRWWYQWLAELGAKPVSAGAAKQIDRLRREAPEFYTEWRDGKHSTPRDALIAAGIITKTSDWDAVINKVKKTSDRVSLVRTIIESLDVEEVELLRHDLGCEKQVAKAATVESAPQAIEAPEPKPLDLRSLFGSVEVLSVNDDPSHAMCCDAMLQA